MKINIQAAIEIEAYLRDLIKERLFYFTRNKCIYSINVSLKTRNTFEANNKLLEVRLKMPGPDLFVYTYAANYEQALDQIMLKLRNTPGSPKKIP